MGDASEARDGLRDRQFNGVRGDEELANGKLVVSDLLT